MGAQIESAIENAGVLRPVMQTMRKAIEWYKVNSMEKDIESRCSITLQQHPVASDPRLDFVAMKMITDMERIEIKADIAEITLRYEKSNLLKSCWYPKWLKQLLNDTKASMPSLKEI